MAFPITLIDLAGSIALLLWGVRMVQTGIQRGFGPRLGVVLQSHGELLSSRPRVEE